MAQETLSRNTGLAFRSSFHQKGTTLSLMITVGATVYYFVSMWSMQPVAVANNIIPPGYGELVLNTVKLFILSQAMQYILLAVSSGSAVAATDHEKMAAIKAARNAYSVLTLGLLAAIASFFWGELVPFYTIDLSIMGFALSEIVKFASQLFYARRTA
ncbi:MAG: hypothetical protein H6634_10450 [Anaerolineales bacterium]|nr:hypothetical protein [Anaerolineales bacterium]